VRAYSAPFAEIFTEKKPEIDSNLPTSVAVAAAESVRQPLAVAR
jgi:hypothetical protein